MNLIRYTLITALSLIFCQASGQKSGSTRPNIILIFADDLGYGDIGVYGQKKFATPNIDRLAATGMRFTDFYSGSTVCAPARASLLTGQTTGHSPVRGNREVMPEGQYPLPQEALTVATILKMNGYQTAAFGKWGLGFTTSAGNPNWKGFEEFYGYICQRQAHDYFPDHLWHNQQRVELPENKAADSVYAASLIHNKAIDYINNVDTDKPFFMYLPYTLPHGDVIVPHNDIYRSFVKKFAEPPLDASKLKKRPHNATVEPYPHAAFATMMTILDQYVGEITEAVENRGLAENTLIIFTSDNGPHNENGGDSEFFDGNGIYRGIKRDLYEGGIREPFIAYWPKTIRPTVEHRYFALWDLFPTFLDLAQLDYKNYNADGISIKPLITGVNGQEEHDFLYWEFHELGGKQAIRKGKWKAVRLNVNKGNRKTELYDLEADPSETTDIAGQHPDVVQMLENLMKNARTSNPDWPLLPEELVQKKAQ